jgi:hypothetical protein
MGASLIERLNDLSDTRDPRGVRHPLVPPLTRCLMAAPAGRTSRAAIAQFGRLRKHRLASPWGSSAGSSRPPPPCPRCSATWTPTTWTGSSAVRWLAVAGAVPGAHLPCGFAPWVAAVVGQMTVEAGTNEHKTALRLLGGRPPLGGGHRRRHVHPRRRGRRGAGAGRGYVRSAKENQPQLRDVIAAAFAAVGGGDFSPHPAEGVGGGGRTATPRGKGHGRVEVRRVTATTG